MVLVIIQVSNVFSSVIISIHIGCLLRFVCSPSSSGRIWCRCCCFGSKRSGWWTDFYYSGKIITVKNSHCVPCGNGLYHH